MNILLVGKLAADHIPIVRELLSRNILRPRYLDDPRAIEALGRVGQANSVLDLLEG